MPVVRPFRRTCRQFVDGHYSEGGRWMYVLHPRFAREPEHYVRAAMLIQKDLQELFEYVEPSDVNCNCYSNRIHALHMRTCIEVEANCKAILTENGYTRAGDWNMGDYRRLEATHLLSGYEISLPIWRGTRGVRNRSQHGRPAVDCHGIRPTMLPSMTGTTSSPKPTFII